MNRLPRRPPRQQLPLRGRLAATSQSVRHLRAIGYSPVPIRRLPHRLPHRLPLRRRYPTPSTSQPTDLAVFHQYLTKTKLYQQWLGLLERLDRPWKWIALFGLIILVIGAIGRLP